VKVKGAFGGRWTLPILVRNAVYLEDDKCAQCGKPLHPSAKYAPHNLQYIKTVTTQTQLRIASPVREHAFPDRVFPIAHIPSFCSTHCVDSAIKPYIDSDWDKEYDQQIATRKSSAARERRSPADSPSLLEGVDRRLHTDIGYIERDRNRHFAFVVDWAKEGFCHAYTHAVTAFTIANPVPPPPTITDANRYEHAHILGASGSGKSTLIQEIGLGDFEKANPPAMIFIDPKGLMVERIAKLKCFHPTTGRLRDRLILIKATDDPAPPLNLFRRTGDRTMVNQAISTFDYIFSQSGNALTPKTRPVFKFCAALMFTIPDADIFLLMDFLESAPNDPRFAPYIANLTDLGAKRFFTKDFYSPIYRETREQVKSRFNDILSMPELLNIFCSESPSIDFAKCLSERKIILVDTGMTKATPGVSQLLGRYIITLTLNAAFARAQIPRSEWTPAFLFIDEFQDFVDEEATPRHFRLAREYNLGLLCAHQNMFCAELNDSIRTAISTNTTIKYCSKPEALDKSYMARDFGCDPSFLDEHVWTKTHGKFACLVKGSPPFSITVPFGNISPEMQMDGNAYAELLRRNRKAFAPTPPRPVQQPPSKPGAPPEPQAPRSQPRSTAAPPKPSAPTTPNDSARLRDRIGALDWEVTISPRIAEAGGGIPLVVQRGGQPVKINVKIPALTKNNTVFRLAGLGHFRPDKTRGDLYLTIKVPPFPEQNTDWADKW
jgi:hypothetical protein